MSCTPCLRIRPVPRGAPRYHGNSIELAGPFHETAVAISTIADALETIGSRFFPARITGPATNSYHPFVEQHYVQGFRDDLPGGRSGPSREASLTDFDFTNQPVLMEEAIDPANGHKAYSFIGKVPVAGSATTIENLDDIENVFIENLAGDDVLIFDAVDNRWENISFEDFVTNITNELNLEDIIETTDLTEGDLIYYDGSDFVNITFEDYLTNNITTINNFLESNTSITNLSDVTTTTPADGDVLTWDGDTNTWINLPGGGAIAGDERWLFRVDNVMYHYGSHTDPVNTEVATWYLSGMGTLTDNEDGTFTWQPKKIGMDDADHVKEVTDDGDPIEFRNGPQGAGNGGGGPVDEKIRLRVTQNTAATIIGTFDLRCRVIRISGSFFVGSVASSVADGAGWEKFGDDEFAPNFCSAADTSEISIHGGITIGAASAALQLDSATGKLEIIVASWATEFQIVIRVEASETAPTADITI